MRHIFAILLLFPLLVYSQTDTTIQYPSFELVEKKISPPYKQTVMDSVLKNNAVSLSDLIQSNSGVFIKNYGPGLASIGFRGTGASHTQVLWNGVSLNAPTNGQVDFSLMPTLFFDNAELNYGASGILTGNGAIGGSVGINNEVFFEKQTNINATTQLGSFGHQTYNVNANISNNKWHSHSQLFLHKSLNNFSFRNITKKDSPLEQLNNAEKEQKGFQQAIYRKIKNHMIGARIMYFASDRNLASPITTDQQTNENQLDNNINSLIEWKGNVNQFFFNVKSGLIYNELTYSNIDSDIISTSTSYLSDNLINTKWHLGKFFQLKNNFNMRYENAESDGYNGINERMNYSWLGLVSYQKNKWNIDISNRAMIVGNNQSWLAPSVGVRYKVLNKLPLYLKGNAAINYHYPTFNDLFWNPGGNPDLLPEKATMTEAGINWETQNNNLTLNAEITSFYNYVENWIIWLPTDFNYWSPTNIQEIENKGVELDVNIKKKINNLNFAFNSAYTYTSSINKRAKSERDNSVGKQLIYVPNHKVSCFGLVGYKQTRFIYQFNYTSERFITSDNNWYLPANYTSDITIGQTFNFSEKYSLNLDAKINNIFDQDYQSIANRPMPKRHFLVTLTLGFKQ